MNFCTESSTTTLSLLNFNGKICWIEQLCRIQCVLGKDACALCASVAVISSSGLSSCLLWRGGAGHAWMELRETTERFHTVTTPLCVCACVCVCKGELWGECETILQWKYNTVNWARKEHKRQNICMYKVFVWHKRLNKGNWTSSWIWKTCCVYTEGDGSLKFPLLLMHSCSFMVSISFMLCQLFRNKMWV